MKFGYSFTEAGDYTGFFDTREEAVEGARLFNEAFGYDIRGNVWTAKTVFLTGITTNATEVIRHEIGTRCAPNG